MTAVTVAPPRTETETIARAKAALAAVGSDAFPWPSTGGPLIRHYEEWLAGDVETYADVETDKTHATSVFPDLADGWPDDAKGKALAWLAEDIGYGTGALVEQVRQWCGDEAAGFVLAAVQTAQQEGERQ